MMVQVGHAGLPSLQGRGLCALYACVWGWEDTHGTSPGSSSAPEVIKGPIFQNKLQACSTSSSTLPLEPGVLGVLSLVLD